MIGDSSGKRENLFLGVDLHQTEDVQGTKEIQKKRSWRRRKKCNGTVYELAFRTLRIWVNEINCEALVSFVFCLQQTVVISYFSMASSPVSSTKHSPLALPSREYVK